jgi:hypothetical protein
VSLTKPPALTPEHRNTLRQQLQILRARQIRCIHVLPNGLKCEGLALRGTAHCFGHDMSPAGKEKRRLRAEHQVRAAKLRQWEKRQERVRLLDPTASTLGYKPMNLGKPRASRRVEI